jgi:hypothetical protein
VAQEHSATAVAGDPEIIQHYGNIFTFTDASFVLIPIIGDYFST